MLFRQPVQHKQKKIAYEMLAATGVFFLIVMTVIVIEVSRVYQVWILLLFPVYFLGIVLNYVLHDFEMFEIYEDKIVARNILRIKNTVLFENVKFVEEGKLNLLLHGEIVDYYILNDGRKNKRPGWQYRNDFRNRKKYNLRIYKTDELEAFLKERFEIRHKDLLAE